MISSSTISSGLTAITTGITDGQQLFNRLVLMAQLVDEKIQEEEQFNKTFSLHDFSMTWGTNGKARFELALTVSNKKVNPNLREAFYQVANEVLDKIKISDELYIAALKVAVNQNLSEYISPDGHSIVERLEQTFKKPKQKLISGQQKEFYIRAYKLMRELYASYFDESNTADSETKKKVHRTGKLVAVDVAEELAEIRRHDSPELRFFETRRLLTNIYVTRPQLPTGTRTELYEPFDTLITALKSFINQKTDARVIGTLEKFVDQLVELYRSITAPIELVTEKSCERLSKITVWLSDTSIEIARDGDNSALSTGIELLMLSQHAFNLLELMTISRYRGTIGLDNNLIRRIDSLVETDVMSLSEKENYLDLIIYFTIENWIDPRQRYEGNKKPSKEKSQYRCIEEFERDVEVLFGVVSMAGMECVNKADVMTVMVSRLASSFPIEKCIQLLDYKYHKVESVFCGSEVLAEITKKYKNVREGFFSQPRAADMSLQLIVTKEQLITAMAEMFVEKLVPASVDRASKAIISKMLSDDKRETEKEASEPPAIVTAGAFNQRNQGNQRSSSISNSFSAPGTPNSRNDSEAAKRRSASTSAIDPMEMYIHACH